MSYSFLQRLLFAICVATQNATFTTMFDGTFALLTVYDVTTEHDEYEKSLAC
jgi:hypothetical protein